MNKNISQPVSENKVYENVRTTFLFLQNNKFEQNINI